jgi:CRISPR-associated protein Cmr1
MRKLTATFRIVTPMFISGADQTKAELRAPSIKGALRFWWRALNWSRLNNEKNLNQNEVLKALRREERLLFGDADDSGQSRILIKLDKELVGSVSGDQLLDNDQRRKYLGYGLFTMGEIRQRFAIKEDETFNIDILLKRNVTEGQHQQLIDSIKLLGMLGGVGSRCRRGFGSLEVQSLNGEKYEYNSLDDYRSSVSNLLKIDTSSSDEPSYTAISQNVRVVYGPQNIRSEEAHRHIGGQYKAFRTQRQHEPRKKFFGLPLYGFGYDKENRRASPLFFHIHPIGNKFVPVILYIPAKFHKKYRSHNFSLVEEFVNAYREEANS